MTGKVASVAHTAVWETTGKFLEDFALLIGPGSGMGFGTEVEV